MRPLCALLLCLLSGLMPGSRAWGQSDTVQVELDSFGVGNQYRPGEFAGIHVTLTAAVDEPTPVWVQLEVPNADGDVAEYGRALTLNRNLPAGVWLYAPLPPDTSNRSVFAVRVFPYVDGQREREFGGARISPSTTGAQGVSPMKSMMAIVGRASLGLRGYQFTGVMPDDRPPWAHEDVRLANVPVEDLPDQWEGLRQFGAIAWGDQSPTPMTLAQGRALREYIQRGGHLIIVLPAEGNPWGIGQDAQSNPLSALLPETAPTKVEEVPLATILAVTTQGLQPRTDFTKSVWVFGSVGPAAAAGDQPPPPSAPDPYEPLIALPDGKVVVVRRSYGFGFVTLVGIDLSDGQLSALGESVRGDVFWNRVLGRRHDTPSAQTLIEMADANALEDAITENGLGGGQLITDLISMSEAAGRGLLTVFVVIVTYWLIAGPIGFLVLKAYKQEKHAWIAFAAAAGVFTAAAWGIVAVIKPSTYEIQHVTYLDILPPATETSGPQHRAASWFSLNMPGYRRTAVFIDSEANQRDLLASWTPPDLPGQPFPNPDRFIVDVGNNPADQKHFLNRNDAAPEFRRPSRSTATQFYAHWMGEAPAWEQGTIWQASPVRTEVDAGANERLVGTLQHDLPGELKDVSIIWIRNARYGPRRFASRDGIRMPWFLEIDSGRMLNQGGMWRLSKWAPGVVLDLAAETKDPSRLPDAIFRRYVDEYQRRSPLGSTSGIQRGDVTNYLEMLGIFDQLTPPRYIEDDSRQGNVGFFRLLGRELDLSTWFTRPCLIVTGHLVGAANPIPLLVNGEPPAHDEGSVVVVRWILPLEIRPDVAFSNVFDRFEDESIPDIDAAEQR